jgi:hypothetical protein
MNSIHSESLDALRVNNIDAHLSVLEDFTPNCTNNFPNEAQVLTWLSDPEFYKESSQEELRCVVQTVFERTRNARFNLLQTPPVLGVNLRTFFPEMQTINYDSARREWKSVEGMATLVGLKMRQRDPTIFPFALMKLQREAAYPDESLLHEIVVGLVLNELRSYLPCFMYVYGGFYCSYPSEADVAQSTRAATRNAGLCSQDGKDKIHSVIVAEAIPNAVSLGEFLGDRAISSDDKYKVFLLVCFALSKANRKFSYVHGDLHGGNVLVRALRAPVTLHFPYTIPGGATVNCSVVTRYIPQIIDYGRSVLTYKGKRITPLSAESGDRLGKQRDKTDMWCYDGRYPDEVRPAERMRGGNNCVMENHVFSGATLPGFDFMRLCYSLGKYNLLNDMPLVVQGLPVCFYNGAYDKVKTTTDPTLNLNRDVPNNVYAGSLLGTADNVTKFQAQYVDLTLDVASHPNCTRGFLNEIILMPQIRPLLGLP